MLQMNGSIEGSPNIENPLRSYLWKNDNNIVTCVPLGTNDRDKSEIHNNVQYRGSPIHIDITQEVAGPSSV